MAIGSFLKGVAGGVGGAVERVTGGRPAGGSKPDWIDNPPEGFIVSSGGGAMGQERARMDASRQMLERSGEKSATIKGMQRSEQWIDPNSGKYYSLYNTKNVKVIPAKSKDSSTKGGLEDQVKQAMERPSEPLSEGKEEVVDLEELKNELASGEEDVDVEALAAIEDLKPADLKKIVREIATEEIEAPPTIASETVAPPPTMASETIAPEPTMESETVRGVDPKSGIGARLASDDERANFQRQLQSQIEQPRDTRDGTNMTTPVGNATQPQGEGSRAPWYSDQAINEAARALFDPGKPTPPDAGAAATPGLDPNLPAEFSRPSVPLRGSMGPGIGDAQHGNIFKQPPPESPPQGQITMKEPSAGYNERMRDAYVSPATEQEAPRETRPFSNADLPTAVAKAFQPDPNAMRTEDITNAMAPMRNFNWNRPTTPAPPPAAPEPGPQMPNEREMRGQALMDSMASRAQTEASQNQGTAAQQAMEAQMTQNDSGSSYQQSRAVEKEGPGLGGKAKGILGKIRDFVDKGADTPAAKYSLDPRKRSREEQQELEAWMAAGRPNDWNWEPKKAIGRRPKLTGRLR